MSVKLTVADAANWHMREAAHYNGGKVFFAYLYRCVEQPRLSRFDRHDKRTKSVKSEWRVDDAAQPDLATAIDALNTPAVFDADELAYLATYPDEWADKSHDMDWSLEDRLVNKGATEWQDGFRRKTDTGRLALATLNTGERT